MYLLYIICSLLATTENIRPFGLRVVPSLVPRWSKQAQYYKFVRLVYFFTTYQFCYSGSKINPCKGTREAIISSMLLLFFKLFDFFMYVLDQTWRGMNF